MKGKPPEAKVERLALGMARGLRLAAAAKSAEIPETSARRYASDPTFRARVNRLRTEVIDQAVGRLAGYAVKAADVLGRMATKGEGTELQYKAARAIMSDMKDMREHAEMYDRLEALEARAGHGGAKTAY